MSVLVPAACGRLLLGRLWLSLGGFCSPQLCACMSLAPAPGPSPGSVHPGISWASALQPQATLQLRLGPPRLAGPWARPSLPQSCSCTLPARSWRPRGTRCCSSLAAAHEAAAHRAAARTAEQGTRCIRYASGFMKFCSNPRISCICIICMCMKFCRLSMLFFPSLLWVCSVSRDLNCHWLRIEWVPFVSVWYLLWLSGNGYLWHRANSVPFFFVMSIVTVFCRLRQLACT